MARALDALGFIVTICGALTLTFGITSHAHAVITCIEACQYIDCWCPEKPSDFGIKFSPSQAHNTWTWNSASKKKEQITCNSEVVVFWYDECHCWQDCDNVGEGLMTQATTGCTECTYVGIRDDCNCVFGS